VDVVPMNRETSSLAPLESPCFTTGVFCLLAICSYILMWGLDIEMMIYC